MSKKLRLGCIGTGNILQHAHMSQHAIIPEYDVTALYDIDKSRAFAARDIYIDEAKKAGREVNEESIVVCDSAQDLLTRADVVDICTTLRYHAYYAALALQNGVSAMSEKPMARTWLEAGEVARCEAAGRARYQLNDDNLFIPRFLTAKALIDGGWIGDILSVRIARGTPSSARASWFYDTVEAGGGAIMDYGSHAISNVWFLIGFDKIPYAVRSMGILTREKTRVIEGRMREISIDDDAHFKVLFKNPKNGDWIDAAIEATWTTQHFGLRSSDVDGYFEVEGTLGNLSTRLDENGNLYIRVKSRTMGERMVPVENVESEVYSFHSEFQNFARSILLDKPAYYNASIAQNTIAVLNAAQLSEQRGRAAVSIEEVKSFSAKALEKAGDVWKAADGLCLEFNKQFARD